jgi:hypothetical protein
MQQQLHQYKNTFRVYFFLHLIQIVYISTSKTQTLKGIYFSLVTNQFIF